ncbi:signal peptidase complex subunit SPC2 [Chaetomidium leptoderma]|uniref:Signal peptidase complex subunit 2 n=1 Tax=Chaetomidium leptoderma TaxID=669021 RepID=A0AAN6VND0_9PEZI|nr:signal peptidase complex subunit SPC2 [Chaetomidium leptoderma]
MATSQEKITVYNLADLKNTSDDAIPNYLNSLGFRQSHHLTDVRLALGYSAFALAAACFAWDYQLGFDSTKYFTAAAVAAYTLLNGALTLWVVYAERGTVYVGTSPPSAGGERTVRISTSTTKGVPTYHLTVEVTGGKKNGGVEVLKVARAFTEWFDAAGHFVAAPFQAMLAGSVPVIGKADPKRAAAAKKESGGDDATPAYTPEMLDVLAQANVSVVGSAAEEATGAEAAGKKGGKRRKA